MGITSRAGVSGGSAAAPSVVQGAVTPSDAFVNPTTAIAAYALLGLFDGTTWDRARGGLATAISPADLALILNVLSTGVYRATPPTLTDGQSLIAQLTQQGYLRNAEQLAPVAEDNTNGVYGEVIKPLATNTYALTQGKDFTNDPDVSWKATAGNVMMATCRNLNAAARYFQIHNKASAPAGADVPMLTYLVPAQSMLVLGFDDFGPNGTYCSTGIATGFSTTEFTYTAGAAGDQAVQIWYK